MRLTILLLLVLVDLAGGACGSRRPRNLIEPVYDTHTGRLQLLKYDSDGDGVIDTWSYMDGPRIVRIEIDQDEDGTIDRWEYYRPDQTLEKVGISRANNGRPDAWSYPNADGSTARLDL